MSHNFEDAGHWNSLTKEYLPMDTLKEENLEGLRNVIRFHEWRYYILDDPIISDKKYDELFSLLKKFEEANPETVDPDSPTQRVSPDIVNEFNSVKHIRPMLSLDNSYNAEDLRDFHNSVCKLTGVPEGTDIEYVVEPKFDGGSIALVYEDDSYVRASTRGDGIRGEDITPNIKTLMSIPLHARFSDYGIVRAELRGEALIKKERFTKINAMREEEGESTFANPRNAATGGLRMKQPTDTAERGIDAFIYQIGYLETEDGKTSIEEIHSHYQLFEILHKLGFKVGMDATKKCKNIDEVIEFCSEWEEKRDSYPYEIDGMVVKVNDLEKQNKMGSTSHHPRWAIAFKFKAKQATSTLKEVEFQVGKIGSITPVAKIEPVQLAGVQISSISLHNEDFITSKDIRLNDHVLVERAGDVIPYIVKSFHELRDGNERVIEFPENCPVCNHSLYRIEGEAAWRCVNVECPAQIMQRMIHFVSKDAMDIDGLGPSLLERFFTLGWIKSIDDIYRLEEEKVSALKDFGDKSAENLIAAIRESKSNPIKRLIHGLSIHHVGKKVSSILAEKIENVFELSEWTEEQLTEIKDLGPVVAGNIVAYFTDDNNLKILRNLQEMGVNMKQTEEDKPVIVEDDAPFKDKTILFTGSLEKMTRSEAKKIAENHGARNLSAVSSNLDFLVVGKNAGSKLTKAKKLGTVEILTEEEFFNRTDS